MKLPGTDLAQMMFDSSRERAALADHLPTGPCEVVAFRTALSADRRSARQGPRRGSSSCSRSPAAERGATPPRPPRVRSRARPPRPARLRRTSRPRAVTADAPAARRDGHRAHRRRGRGRRPDHGMRWVRRSSATGSHPVPTRCAKRGSVARGPSGFSPDAE